MAELKVFEKNDKDWTIYFKVKATKVAIDITGSTLLFTVKKLKTDDEADALIKKDITSHVNPATGETKLSLSKTDTDLAVGVYFFDFKYVDSAGKDTTLGEGTFRIQQGVTDRTV